MGACTLEACTLEALTSEWQQFNLKLLPESASHGGELRVYLRKLTPKEAECPEHELVPNCVTIAEHVKISCDMWNYDNGDDNSGFVVLPVGSKLETPEALEPVPGGMLGAHTEEAPEPKDNQLPPGMGSKGPGAPTEDGTPASEPRDHQLPPGLGSEDSGVSSDQGNPASESREQQSSAMSSGVDEPAEITVLSTLSRMGSVTLAWDDMVEIMAETNTGKNCHLTILGIPRCSDPAENLIWMLVWSSVHHDTPCISQLASVA